MNPLEHLLVWFVVDAATEGSSSEKINTGIEEFFRKIKERPLLAASLDLSVYALGLDGILRRRLLGGETWQSNLRDGGDSKQDQDRRELIAILDAQEIQRVKQGESMRARWIFLLTGDANRAKPLMSTPALRNIGVLANDFLPVVVNEPVRENNARLWGRTVMQLRPIQLSAFMGDVVNELERCLWGVPLPPTQQGLRLERWSSAHPQLQADHRAKAQGTEAISSDTIDPAISISVRKNWKPIE